MKFDELNKLKEYFSSMRISEEEKEKRASVGELFYDAFFYVLTLLKADAMLNDEIDSAFYVNTLNGRLIDSLETNNISYDMGFIQKLSTDVIESTVEHYGEEEYFTNERYLRLAEDETNATCNYSMYIEAKKKGKKYKMWLGEKDDRMRTWHLFADGQTVGIDDYFHVGPDMLRFPHDQENASTAENIAGCRCSYIFI